MDNYNIDNTISHCGFVSVDFLEDDYLAHYGVRGMKWGVRKDGASGSKQNGKIQNTVRKGIRATTSFGSKAIARVLGLHRMKKNGKVSQDDEEFNKALVIRKGDVKKAYEKRDSLSDGEIQAVINRYNKNQELKSLAIKTKREKVDALAKNLETGANLLDQGTKFYNNTARIINAFGDKELPTINTGGPKKGKKPKDLTKKDNEKDKNN